MPPPPAADIKTAAETFRATSSVGCEGFLQRLVAELSAPLRAVVASPLKLVELTDWWQGEYASSIIHFIPKFHGGRRPIGVLPSIVRVWERARKPLVEQWRQTCARDYDWMRKGKGSEGLAWAQTIYEEVASSSGKATAPIYVDLDRAFEQVVLGICTLSRRVSYKGAVSKVADATIANLRAAGVPPTCFSLRS